MTDTSLLRGRRIDLDWLRIIAFGLLMFYHLSLLYVPWPYHAKSRYTVSGLVPLLEALNPWRLLLLFLISGVATRFMARRLEPFELFFNRSVRLLPPLLFGMWVIVPPQSFIQAVEQYNYSGNFISFYRDEYLVGAGNLCNAAGCLAVPTWNHLWFVLYLWVYTLLLVGLLLLLRAIRVRVVVPALAAVLLPLLALFAARALLFGSFPANDAFLNDWYDHAIYGGAFLFGYFVAENEPFWKATERLRWPLLAVAALSPPSIWAAGGVALPATASHSALPPVLGVPLYQWAALLAAFGFGGRWLPHQDSPERQMLTQAVFPFYIVHQTALVVCAHILRTSTLPAAPEAAIILGTTSAICMTTYWAARRVALLRPVFGLPLRPASQMADGS